ncbi:MAG TPA: PIN domain-containing protein, partial [Gemmatales bacterium]|nr:PIN domain-containing protein [Gemmatales bacterium]
MNNKPGSILLWIIRGIFLLCVLGVATGFAIQGAKMVDPKATGGTYIAIPFAYLVLIVLLGIGVIALDMRIKDKQITTISAIYFGLLLGLLFGHLFTSAIFPLMENEHSNWLLNPLRILITVFFCYICVSTLFQTKDDFRFIIPYVEFSKQIKGSKALVLDTSVIIDGRIADICDTKIIDTRLIVPRFVLQELQNVADSSDKLRRNRGRRGMDMLKRMQNNPKVDLQIHEGNIPELQDVQEVDQRLVILAKTLSARVVTNDYNLNKVAQLQGVEVININELANAMKSVALPGEVLKVKLIKAGDQIGQGVGYLDDGTMVVVEQGRALIGQDISMTVTSVLQTSAGRMIFGRADGKTGQSSASHQVR